MSRSGPRFAGVLAAVGMLVSNATAHAESRTTSVVNTTGPQGAPVAVRLSRLLDGRGKLVPQPAAVAAVLEGQPAARPTFEEVRKALSDFRYQDAERLLEDLSDGLLESSEVEVGKPLAEVLWWQGLVAAVDDREKPPEQRRKAKLYFAAAYQLDAEVTIDPTLAPPRVRLLMEEAKRPRTERGALELTVNADQAEVSVDGAAPANFAASLEVPTGLHLLRVSAPSRASVLRLVEVTRTAPVRLAIELPKEVVADKVRRLVSEATSAPEGRARLPVLTQLSRVVGAKQLLLVEALDAQRAKIRLYDVSAKRMSQQFSFAQSDSSSAVAAAVDGAYRLADDEGLDRRWYQRWQVWAGVAVVSGIVIAVVINATQEPRIQGL